jgi:hypothetical protein
MAFGAAWKARMSLMDALATSDGGSIGFICIASK